MWPKALVPACIRGDEVGLVGQQVLVKEIVSDGRRARVAQAVLATAPKAVGEMTLGELLERGGSTAEAEFVRRAMVSPEAFQQALDAKEANSSSRYWLGYGKPWFADPGLRFVRFVVEAGSEESLTWAVFARSDGKFGATYGWVAKDIKTGQALPRGQEYKAFERPCDFKIIPTHGVGIDVSGPDWDPNEERKGKTLPYLFPDWNE